jgi:hypothetical protein
MNRTVAGQEKGHFFRMNFPSTALVGPPSVVAIFFGLLALAVPTLLQNPVLNSDGDLARHLRHGHYMLEHAELIRADPFSYTRPGAPFVGFEYGSQLVYALVDRLGGLPAVAIVAGLLVALTYALLAQFLLRRGVDPLLACLTVAVAVTLGVPHWMARPHLFSFLAVVILMILLETPKRKSVVACAVLFAIWANLHGGFLYGLILIGLYLLGSLGELFWEQDRRLWEARAKQYLLMLTAAGIVTLLNPYGLKLHRHLIEFFNQPFLRDNTAEFVSPNFHEPDGKLFLAALLLTFSTLALHRQRPTLTHLVVIIVSTAFALISVRNIPLFGLTALPLVALEVSPAWRSLPGFSGVRERFRQTVDRTSTLPWVAPVLLLLGILAVNRGQLGSLQVIRDEFDPTIFPVTAVSKARSAGLEGHIFTPLTWGGYLLYAWPEQPIFIDGGTDFFGEDIFRAYTRIRRLSPGWRKLIQDHDVSLMLLERQTALTHELARDRGWAVWYCDSLAVLFRRSQALSTGTADSTERSLETCAMQTSHPLGNRQQ